MHSLFDCYDINIRVDVYLTLPIHHTTPFTKVKRGRGRPKKQKLDSSPKVAVDSV